MTSSADKRGIFIPRFGVGIGSMIQQQLDHLLMASRDSPN